MAEEQEKGSRLKSALGLENLKGLGDTLAQIKDVKESLDAAQRTIGEVAQENSPLGRALARLVEAQGQVALNADNVNVSEEVRRNMAEELKGQEKKIEGLEAENQGLREDRQVRDITQAVEAKLDERLPQSGGGGNDSGQGKLMDALEKVVADYMEKRLMGGGEGTLSAEQIRSVIREEVAAVGGGKKGPEEMVEDLVKALTMGDTLREKLGVAGIGGRLIQGQGGDSGLRTDLVKALLEDERERLKIRQDHESAMQKNQHLGTLAGAVKDNLSDGIAALKSAADEAAKASTVSQPASEQPQVFACGTCGVKFSPPPGWDGQPLECPKPNGGCGRIYTKEELLA